MERRNGWVGEEICIWGRSCGVGKRRDRDGTGLI